MNKIADLHRFIIELDLFAAEQMDSDVDGLVVSPSGRDTTVPGQIVVAEVDYTAVFFIERYPHGQVGANVLLAQIAAWLLENDTERTEPINFAVTTDVADAQIADIEFSIPFAETVLAQESAEGEVTLNGTRYALL